MSKDGYYGDFNSFAEEQEAYRQWMESQEQEPEVIPCQCGNPMWETEEKCESCRNLLTPQKEEASNENDWINEFDEKFGKHFDSIDDNVKNGPIRDNGIGGCIMCGMNYKQLKRELKQFIKTTIDKRDSEAYEQGRKDCAGEVE